MFRRSSPSSLHQSDSVCGVRFEYEATHSLPSGHFATVGTLAHLAIERLCLAQVEHPGVEPMSVLREVLREALGDEEVTSDVVGDTIAIMAKAFASKDLTLGLPPSPWTVATEWRWALDEDFRPIAPCSRCDRLPGSSMAHGGAEPQCSGWETIPAYEGTVDRLEMDRAGGRVAFWDWKSTIARESNEELRDDKQFQWYSVAILAHFPDATSVVGRKAFLRHGYATRHEFSRAGAWHEQTRERMHATRAKRLDAIERREWSFQPGPACSFCPILFSCRELERRRAEGSEPPGDLTYQANTLLALRAQLAVIDSRLRAHVRGSETPIPLDDGEGTALGMKPVRGYMMARSYERTMNELEAIGLSAQRREDLFRFVTEDNLPSRVKKALEELVGRKHARSLIEAGGWLDETTNHEFGVWTPDPESAVVAEPATAEDVEDEIAKALREDPERTRRIAAALKG